MVSSSFHLPYPIPSHQADLFYMARALTRTNFHSSRLLRVLADLSVVDTDESGTGFAEKLGQWLNLNDAITLHGALKVSAAGTPAAQFGMSSLARDAIGDEFTRVRTTLENSIRKTTLPAAGRTVKSRWPSAIVDEPLDVAAVYAPHRRYYLSQQRDMEVSVGALRVKVREALSTATPALKKLAILDAVLDGMLSEHESKFLGTVPSLLEKRFQQLFNAHQQALVKTQLTDSPECWMRPGGWLANFRNDLQTALLAELDLRLQPAMGLIEALNNEKTNHK